MVRQASTACVAGPASIVRPTPLAALITAPAAASPRRMRAVVVRQEGRTRSADTFKLTSTPCGSFLAPLGRAAPVATPCPDHPAVTTGSSSLNLVRADLGDQVSSRLLIEGLDDLVDDACALEFFHKPSWQGRRTVVGTVALTFAPLRRSGHAPSSDSDTHSGRQRCPITGLAFPLVDDWTGPQVDDLRDPVAEAAQMLAVVFGAGLADPLICGLIWSSQTEPPLQHPGPGVIGR